MEIIKLPEPEPRERELDLDRVRYRSTTPQYLAAPSKLPHADFFQVLEARRTTRIFGPLSKHSLALLLWTVGKTRLTYRESSGHLWEHRCSPSAGGRHPIDFVIIPPPTRSARACVYDPIGHALHELPHNEPAIRDFYGRLQTVVPTESGTVIWLVANYRRTLAKYQHPESLVWRDAGVLIASICFVAEALQLNCCPYGVNGDEFVSQLFGDALLGGVGGCVIGGRSKVVGVTTDR